MTPADTPRSPPAPVQHAIAIGLTGLALIAALLLEGQVGAPNLSLIFVLPVVIAAAVFGWSPALVAAAAGLLAFNFFLIEPRHTFAVAGVQDLWGLGLLAVVAAIVSAVAAQARGRALEARRAADQALALQSLARTLVGARGEGAIAEACADALGRLFQAPAAIFIETDQGVSRAAGSPAAAPDIEAARWAMASRTPTRASNYPVEAAGFDIWPALAANRPGCALGVAFGAEGRPSGADALAEAVAGYLVVALGREALARQVEDARVEHVGEKLKADLLAAVSHDLKTPLSTVQIALQSLLAFDHDEQTRSELLRLAETETTRLSGLVRNLLDMGRLEAGAVAVGREALRSDDLVAAALRRAGAAVFGHEIVRTGAVGASLLGDAPLSETALAALLENAAKYGAADAPIHIRTGYDEAEAWIEVQDEGPGFQGAIEPLFEKFVRGVEGDGRPPGTGLGLAIARGFAEAQGGRVEAANRPDGRGAVVRFTLPRART